MASLGTKDIEPNKDLSGKVAIVTGPTYNSIGYFTAKAFAERGSTVILAGRDLVKLEESASKIRAELGNKGNLITQLLDLSDLESVDTFARQFQERGLPLNYLINNAGIMASDFGKTTKQGFEAQIGTNHLGHYYLTKLLIPQLKQGAPSRIINLSSRSHAKADNTSSEKFDQLFHPTSQTYSRFGQYGNSKVANILHARVLNEQYAREGITAYSVHPGVVKTDLGRQTWFTRVFYCLGGLWMKSPDQGAATTMYCALSDKALTQAGSYFADCDVLESTKPAQDMTYGHALCDYSDKLIAEWQASKKSSYQGEEKQLN